MKKPRIRLAIAVTMACAALGACSSPAFWVQRTDGKINFELRECAYITGTSDGEVHRQCLLDRFNLWTYDRPYLEYLGFRCGFTDQYCLLHQTERQYGIYIIQPDYDHFREYRTDIYLKYTDQKLTKFRLRHETVDEKGNVRLRYETPDTLPNSVPKAGG